MFAQGGEALLAKVRAAELPVVEGRVPGPDAPTPGEAWRRLMLSTVIPDQVVDDSAPVSSTTPNAAGAHRLSGSARSARTVCAASSPTTRVPRGCRSASPPRPEGPSTWPPSPGSRSSSSRRPTGARSAAWRPRRKASGSSLFGEGRTERSPRPQRACTARGASATPCPCPLAGGAGGSRVRGVLHARVGRSCATAATRATASTTPMLGIARRTAASRATASTTPCSAALACTTSTSPDRRTAGAASPSNSTRRSFAGQA